MKDDPLQHRVVALVYLLFGLITVVSISLIGESIWFESLVNKLPRIIPYEVLRQKMLSNGTMLLAVGVLTFFESVLVWRLLSEKGESRVLYRISPWLFFAVSMVLLWFFLRPILFEV